MLAENPYSVKQYEINIEKDFQEPREYLEYNRGISHSFAIANVLGKHTRLLSLILSVLLHRARELQQTYNFKQDLDLYLHQYIMLQF